MANLSEIFKEGNLYQLSKRIENSWYSLSEGTIVRLISKNQDGWLVETSHGIRFAKVSEDCLGHEINKTTLYIGLHKNNEGWFVGLISDNYVLINNKEDFSDLVQIAKIEINKLK